MVFVPAIMGAGVVFSTATLVSDVLSHGTRTALTRRAKVRGRMVAASVVEPEHPGLVDASHPVPRSVAMLVGAGATVFGLYVAIGATGNYLRSGGYTNGIAWLWALNLLVVIAAWTLARASLALASHADESPPWVWDVLVPSPLLGLDDGPPTDRVRVRRSRWFVVGAATVTALLTGLATWPHVLRPFDRRVAELFDADAISALDDVGRLAGSTPVTLVVVAGLALATLRCKRLTWVFISTVAASLLLTSVIRWFVRRPRPLNGPFAGQTDSFPSGHLVQITLLATLVPLAVHELTGSARVRRWVQLVFAVGVAIVAISRINTGLHHASDVIAGAAIGMMIGRWGQLALLVPGSHIGCRGCRTATSAGSDSLGENLGRAPRAHRHGRPGVVDIPDTVAVWLRIGSVTIIALAAVLLGALGLSGELPRNPEGYWLDPVEVPGQIGLLSCALAGAAIALRRPALAAIVIALSGVGLAVMAAVAHPPLIAVGVAAVFVLPSVALWLSWQRHETPLRISALALVTASLLFASWFAADATYNRFFGPAHPASNVVAIDDPAIVWAWAGAVTDTGFHVVARPETGVDRVGLRVRSGRTVVDLEPREAIDGVVRFDVEGLMPDLNHDYEFTVGGAPTGVWTGRVRTFANRGVDHVTIAVASCARTGSNGSVFDAIRAAEPDLYVISGDAHYSDIGSNDPVAFDRAFERVLTAPAQAALYRSAPIAYVWDDHDYSGNDGDSSAASRPAARESYERNVPHHPLVSAETINQAFSVDGVRVVLLDTRSARVPGETLLGSEQLDWLEAELLASSPTHDLVVIVSPTPWIGAPSATSDTWAGFSDERARIAQWVADRQLRNLMIVGGDAHMVAIDDGTNSDYADDGDTQIPVFQAAALDRPGSVKGGPYSEGTFPGAGQFGLIHVRRDGDRVDVTLEGRRYDGERIVAYTFRPAM